MRTWTTLPSVRYCTQAVLCAPGKSIAACLMRSAKVLVIVNFQLTEILRVEVGVGVERLARVTAFYKAEEK